MESLQDHDRTSGFKRAPRAPQHRFCRRLSSIGFITSTLTWDELGTKKEANTEAAT